MTINADWNTFIDFYRGKISYCREHFNRSLITYVGNGETIDFRSTETEVLTRLGISVEDFQQRFILPFQGLDFETLDLVVKVLTLNLRTPDGKEVYFRVSRPPALRSLDWTVAQLQALEFQNLNVFARWDAVVNQEMPYLPQALVGNLGASPRYEMPSWIGILQDSHKDEDLAMPYLQCLWCGAFNEKFKLPGRRGRWFCHGEKCPTGKRESGNASAHDPSCCWAQFDRFRDKWKTRIRRALETEEGKRAKSRPAIILEMLEELYALNERKTEDVRPRLQYSRDAALKY